jgi:hypothetical protein
MAETKDIATILAQRDQNKYREIIVRAANNGYHDHKFGKIPDHPEYGECVCPKVQLVSDLDQFPELSDIRQQGIAGVYDEAADDQDVEEMRGWLIHDGATDQMFDPQNLKRPTAAERKTGRPITN